MRRGFPRTAWIVVCTPLLMAGLGLWGCGGEVASVDVTTQPTSTGPAATSITTASGSPTTVTVAASETTTTAVGVGTTSAAWAAGSKKGTEAALRLGDAVISYLSEKGDLATVQGLVAASAQEDLAQMLSLLTQPTGCKVTVVAGSDPCSVVQVVLLFADGKSQQPDYSLTIVVDPDKTTITAIKPGSSVDHPTAPPTVMTTEPGITTGSSPPVIQMLREPKLEYLSPNYAYYTAEAVVLGTVVEVLPLRRNPLAGTGDPDGPNEYQPVVYKGYVLQVEKAYGPGSIPERITVYALGNGTVVLDEVTYEVRDEFPLDASLGDTFFVPLVKTAYFGTPELKQNEYWVQANWAVFAVDDSGRCTRVTGADLDYENRSEFTLSFLEQVALEQGKEPSLVD